MRPTPSARLLVLGILAWAAMSAAAAPPQSWTARYPLPAGGQVAVANVQGSIEVEGWDRAEVELTVTTSGGGEEAGPGDVAIQVEPQGNSLRVRTLYPRETESPVQVDYRLRVPRQVRLQDLRTVSGDITVRNVEGPVEAHTLSGDIEQTGVAGSVLAQTVNGNVSVFLRALPEPGDRGEVRLETINGDLYLLLPDQAEADLELSTVAGRIESEMLFLAGGPGDANTLRTRLGRGGTPVRLRTIRGDIHVAAGEDLL